MGGADVHLVQTAAELEAPVTRRDALIEYFASGPSPAAVAHRHGVREGRRRRATGAPCRSRARAASRRCCAGSPSATAGRRSRRTAARSPSSGRKASITLEPGGQVELSRRAVRQRALRAAEFARHIDEIVSVGDELDIAFLGLGMQPVSRVEEIELVPKRRYGIMGPHMPGSARSASA